MNLDRREFFKKTARYATPLIVTASVRPMLAGSPYASPSPPPRRHRSSSNWFEQIVEQVEEI